MFVITDLYSFPLRAFLKSVLFGAVAGALPFLLLISVMNVASLTYNGVTGENALAALMIVLLPLVVALAIVAVAGLLIGVPVTMFLSRMGWENASTYVIAGTFFGGAIPIVWSAISGLHQIWLPLMGAVSGAATARTWWINARSPHSPVQADTMLDKRNVASNADPVRVPPDPAPNPNDQRPRI